MLFHHKSVTERQKCYLSSGHNIFFKHMQKKNFGSRFLIKMGSNFNITTHNTQFLSRKESKFSKSCVKHWWKFKISSWTIKINFAGDILEERSTHWQKKKKVENITRCIFTWKEICSNVCYFYTELISKIHQKTELFIKITFKNVNLRINHKLLGDILILNNVISWVK